MPKRLLSGTVISSTNDKTILVKVENRYRHPVYQKTVKKYKKYQAHDQDNKYKVGDKVEIIESRPISKNKTWTVL